MPEDVFRWVIAIGVFLLAIAFVVQTALVFAVYRMARVTQDRVVRVVNAVTPVIGMMGRFVDENKSKFSQMANEACRGFKSLQEQVNRLGEVVQDVTNLLSANVARIDGATDWPVQHMRRAGDVVKQTILVPVRRMGVVLHELRAALSVLSQSRRESVVDHELQDEEISLRGQ